MVRERAAARNGAAANGRNGHDQADDADQGGGAELLAHPLAAFAARPHDWLMPGRLALGTLAILAGDKSAGKSTVATALAASLAGARGKLPGQAKAVRGSTLWLTSEEDPETQLRPRIEAHGGQPDAVLIVGHDPRGGAGRLPCLPGEWGAIGDLIDLHGARLVVIDGISSMTEGGMNLCNEGEARALLNPAALLARQKKCLIVVIRHNRKSQTGSDVAQVLGGVGVTADARTVLTVRELGTDEGTRALLTTTNLGPKQAPLLFRLEDRKGSPRVAWEGECDAEDRRIADAQPDAGKRLQSASAEDYVLSVLKRGPAKARDIFAAAAAEGYGWDALWRAARRIGATIRRKGFGREGYSVWSLAAD